MPIRVKSVVDPLTGASEREPSRRIFARSDVFDRLCADMMRYALQEISGRSFLISGHRGAGKTTVVYSAVESVRRELENSRVPIRPLLVRLHGPDLLPTEEQVSRAGESVVSTPAGQTGNSAELPAAPATRERDPVSAGTYPEIVLKQVAVSLYRAAAEEFSKSIHRRVIESAALPRREREELMELAAGLRVELDAAPDLARLRAFWNRAGRLGTGVLFSKVLFGSDESTLDRGLLELTALSSAAQAYRVISGKTTETETTTDEAKRSNSWTLAASAAAKELQRPFLSLLGGVLAGAVMWDPKNPLRAVVAGLLAQIAVSFSLSFTGTRSRDNTRKRDVVFLPDRTISSLDRMIPVLVERFRRAGLAPVFVVDELDKIESPRERIGILADHLKHFVTERAFFCFLTDRSYLEAIEREAAAKAYPREHTYFSDRLLVHYRPAELREYIAQVFEQRTGGDPVLMQAEADDLKVLPWILAHRSKSHAFDLQREIARMTGPGGAFNREPGAVLTVPKYSYDLLIQVAAEFVLSGASLDARMLDDTHFAQLALDAVYYASRMWQRGGPKLDLSKAAFQNYLRDRTGFAEGSPSAVARPRQAVWSKRRAAAPQTEEPVSAEDFLLLHGAAREVAGYLADPARLIQALG